MAEPTTVSELAHAIADDIERMGHFQRPRDEYPDLYDIGRSDAKCCVLANPTLHDPWADGMPSPEQVDLFMQFEKVLLTKIDGLGIAAWSDSTPTDKVLATLRSL